MSETAADTSPVLIPLLFEGQAVRVVTIDGEPHFVGKDVAERLGYANPADAITKHCKGVAKRYPLQTPGGVQDLRVLSEPDVLRLIVGSQLPAAERFERWVFEDVLPSIRKTGGYTAPTSSRSTILRAPAMATTFKAFLSIGRAIGLDANQAALAAARATRNEVGQDPLQALGVTHLLAPQQEALVTPTDIGARLDGKSAIAVNKLLVTHGFQAKAGDGSWEPTEKGRPFAIFSDTGKKHSDGTPVRQLRWSAGIVAALQGSAT